MLRCCRAVHAARTVAVRSLATGGASPGGPPPGSQAGGAQGTRTEHDTLGEVQVPASSMWGAQTHRSLANFAIGRPPGWAPGTPFREQMPVEIVHAVATVKRAAAAVNARHYGMDAPVADAIVRAADEVRSGRHDTHFPLVVWQTGSGTQTNMNVNEVIAFRARQLLAEAGGGGAVHPNDDVNRSQSSNDTFPTAMHIAVVAAAKRTLLPGAERLLDALHRCAHRFADVVKIGRTHLQDAVPLRLGDEFGCFAAQLEAALGGVRAALPRLHELAQGATAVGTGLNAPAGFASRVVAEIAAVTGEPFVPARNRFEALACHDALVEFHGALNTLAVAMHKVACDVRLAASGPRCGLGELVLPANEPGSSIMPGKVNPTQCEAVAMVAMRVFGNHATVTFAGASGHFQLNACKPLIASAVLQSTTLLGDVARSFAQHCVEGIEVDRKRIARDLGASLMLVTALAPHLGYERAAAIAKDAHAGGTTLREAALAAGVPAEDFDRWVVPEAMLGPGDA